jgi:hypothetical protein
MAKVEELERELQTLTTQGHAVSLSWYTGRAPGLLRSPS